MRTIQITIDEPLLAEVDEVVRRLGTTRSALIRDSLTKELRRAKIRQMEIEHAEAYARQPLNLAEEVEPWLAIAAWDSDWSPPQAEGDG